jgi:diguanylate cyclase (GGDEF)-like protein
VPEIPIIVLTSLDSEALALRVVREGAQDYLVKGQVDGKLLVRSIRYAIERHRMQTALRSMLLIDDLTGLYNRRGFLIIAEQHLQLARRAKKGLLLVLSDLDNLKLVNDTYGHPEGDRALIKVAEILRETFRSSDIIARVGGDEFVALAIETSKMNADILVNRLQENVRAYNEKKVHSYRLSLSVGVACYSPDECPFSIDELLNRADKLMYEQKRKKKIERLRTY